MKWMLPAALLAISAVGLWLVLDDSGVQDENPDAAIYSRAGIDGAPGSVPEEGAMRVEAPPRVGVIGRAGPSDYEGDGESWREQEFVWPTDESRVTGRVLAQAVAKHVPIRFPSDAEMQEFFAHEFLDHIPTQRNRLFELRQLVKEAGFIEEMRGNFVLLRKDPGEKRPR